MNTTKKFLIWLLIGFATTAFYNFLTQSGLAESSHSAYYQQFQSDDGVIGAVREGHWLRNNGYIFLIGVWLTVGGFLFYNQIKNGVLAVSKNLLAALFIGMMAFSTTGCYRPFEPVTLQEIATNEEGFLIPLIGDTTKQSSTASEEFLTKSLVLTKQVRIPYQWVPAGYEWFGVPNGNWKPSGTLIKVDRSPVTREWTADPMSGTSNKNEAIWVMTADQVEFSTGWTCTARILTRDDAVKFLFNYPNGALGTVLDQEVRAKIQSSFGLEVTDLPMDELRKNSTPHMLNTIKHVTEFFQKRGITITNLGITGGFVYKNATIQEKLVEVFNSEQEKNIDLAKSQAQEMRNKTILLEAQGKAEALLRTKKAEAEGIKMVADAKSYEITKAKEDSATYMDLKRIELELKKVEKWDGKFPEYFMGGNPSSLLSIPAATPIKVAK